MKRIAVAVMMLVACGLNSYAAFSLDFSHDLGIPGAVYTDSLLTTRATVNTWTAQLIWSNDSTADMFTDTMNPLTSLGAGETQLALLTPSYSNGRITGTDYLDSGFPESTTQTYSQTGGYVYARLFNSLTPGEGSYYYQTPVSGPMAAAPTINTLFYGKVYFDTQIVPEPSTYALVALGVGIIVLRRRMVG